MFGSSSGAPYWHQPTAVSPSKTNAACALPSRTSCSLSARLPSTVYVFSAVKVWKYVHQHPPHTPLCRSTRSANAPHVSAASGLIVSSPSDLGMLQRRPHADKRTSGQGRYGTESSLHQWRCRGGCGCDADTPTTEPCWLGDRGH